MLCPTTNQGTHELVLLSGYRFQGGPNPAYGFTQLALVTIKGPLFSTTINVHHVQTVKKILKTFK